MDGLIVKLIGIFAIVLMQVFDWHSTVAFMKSGNGYETQSTLAKYFKKYGVSKTMIIKGLLHLPLLPVFYFLPPIAVLGLIPLGFIYTRAVIKNYRIAKGYYKGR